jgi:putative transposase
VFAPAARKRQGIRGEKTRMSLARMVVPGRCYMITRRCSERRFFMRPDSETTNAFIYCLALAARRSTVKVIFTAAMSNHHH